MKISTKGRYALRLMLDIALQNQVRPMVPVPLRDVAKRQGLSDKYLEQIVTPLSRAGLVRSVRGASGGYFVAKPVEELTVGDILRPLEGSLAPVDCLSSNGQCERMEKCVTKEVWDQVEEAITSVVDHITLADLLQRAHEKGCD